MPNLVLTVTDLEPIMLNLVRAINDLVPPLSNLEPIMVDLEPIMVDLEPIMVDLDPLFIFNSPHPFTCNPCRGCRDHGDIIRP